MTTLVGIIALLAIVAGLIFWASRQGSGKELAEAKASKEAAKAAAAEERLEMHRDATAIERDIAGMTDEELDEELARWSRKQPPR